MQVKFQSCCFHHSCWEMASTRGTCCESGDGELPRPRFTWTIRKNQDCCSGLSCPNSHYNFFVPPQPSGKNVSVQFDSSPPRFRLPGVLPYRPLINWGPACIYVSFPMTITADIAEGVTASNKMTGDGSQAGCPLCPEVIYDVTPQHCSIIKKMVAESWIHIQNIFPSIYGSIYPCLSIYLSIYLSLSMSVYLCLSLSISIYLYSYLYLSLSTSIYLPIYLPIEIYLSFYLPLCISKSIYLSIYLSF